MQSKKRNLHLHGVKHDFTIWFVTVVTGVFLVNVYGVFRFRCFMRKTVNQLLRMKRLRMFRNLFREHGSNIWFERDAKDLLPEGFTHEGSPNGEFTKETDIMDVWFDSGSTHQGVLVERDDLVYPADFILKDLTNTAVGLTHL